MLGKSAQNLFYNLVWKRTSTTALFVGVGAICVEQVVDKGIDAFWDSYNKGVS